MKSDWVVNHLSDLQEHFETDVLRYCPFSMLALDVAEMLYNLGGLSLGEWAYSNNISWVARNGHRAIINYMPTSTLVPINIPVV